MKWLIALAALLLVPAAAAGTPEDPELEDGTSDVGMYVAGLYATRPDPIANAHDVLALWASDDDGVSVTLQMADVGTIDDYPPGAVFWAYIDYEWMHGKETQADGHRIYMDKHGMSAWRAYLRAEAGDNVDLTPVIDVAAGTVSITFPEDIVGNATGIGAFRVQSSHAENAYQPGWSTDWAPDNAEACDCWLGWAGPFEPEPAQEAPAADKESPAPLLFVPLLVALLRRR